MKTILTVISEILENKLIADHLEREGYQVLKVKTGEEALTILPSAKIDLILIDWHLQDTVITEFIKEVRMNHKNCTVSIILLSTQNDENSKVIGLETGADDYIVKPFSIQELIARMKAVIRRREGLYESKQEELEDIIVADYLIINKTRRTATKNGELIPLSYLEFELLYLFAKNRGFVLTRDEIMEQLWGRDYTSETRSIDVHISKLRKKIHNEQEHSLYIKPVIGIGYKLDLRG
ncbi:MAG: DNA-binding response regulator [Lachnospiraceae bacterium]|jgi:two-component system alkaline phosphatase synthesis response regulator PhoP|nr:DNA-binding response regulator [Lachnospiraceae bacterium]